MVSNTAQFADAPPLDLFRASSRFWFHNEAVAFGLLTNEHSGSTEPRYWKWNRHLDTIRITPISLDKKLHSNAPILQSKRFDPLLVLSYKPESRLAWRKDAEAGTQFCKAYRRTSFQRAAEGAACLKDIAGPPHLHKIDVIRRVIRWEWIEGNSPSGVKGVEMPLELVRPLHAVAFSTDSCLPRLTPEKIRRHLRDRFEAFAAWLPVLIPPAADRLRLLEEDFATVSQQLAELAAPRCPHLIHGDLRRRNILIDTRGKPRLLDCDHVAIGEREWDIAAWLAESRAGNGDSTRERCKTLANYAHLDGGRLEVYERAWRLLIALKSIEEGPDEDLHHFA